MMIMMGGKVVGSHHFIVVAVPSFQPASTQATQISRSWDSAAPVTTAVDWGCDREA